MAGSSLIGRRLKLMVSDPWGFGTQNGCGPFEVVVKGESGIALLLELVRPFQFENATWTLLAATPRHKDVEIKALLNGSEISVNVIRVKEGDVKFDSVSFGWKKFRGAIAC